MIVLFKFFNTKVFILLITLLMLNSCSSSRTTLELFDDHFEIWSESPAALGIFEDMDNAWLNAVKLYDAGRCEEAIPALKSMDQFPNFQSQTSMQIRLGVCYLKLAQPQLALSHFNNVDASEFAYSIVEWYKAMSYLQLDNREEAKKILERIIKVKENYNAEKAKKILEEI